MFLVDIYKNWIDYIWGWSSVVGAILIPVLIWFFGASRFENNKIEKEKQESLNYLLTSIYRYFQYFINLKQMVINKQNAMLQFLNNPTEESKVQAFSIFTPPAIDFDIIPSKYSFTISKENLIVDIIFQFLQILSDVNGNLEYINNDMKKIFDENVPIETFVRIAQGNVSANIPGLIYKINMGLFMMFRLMEIVENYNKYLDKKYRLMCIFVPNYIMNLIQSIKLEITMFVGNSDWEKPFMKTEITKQKNIKEKIVECLNKHIENIKNILIKSIIIIIILMLIIFLYITSAKMNFCKTIVGITIGCLIPFLFDETKVILSILKNLKEKLNPIKYKQTFDLYNEGLFRFANHFYSFLLNISTKEKRNILVNAIKGDVSIKKISLALKELLQQGQLEFQRITVDNNQTFNDISLNHLKLANGEVLNIYNILRTLPPELDFTIKRCPEFINIQSGFHQVSSILQNMPESMACEAFTESLIKDVILFLDIQ